MRPYFLFLFDVEIFCVPRNKQIAIRRNFKTPPLCAVINRAYTYMTKSMQFKFFRQFFTAVAGKVT